jgi:uncharacterized FAD-dependent dehydrogenase
MALPERILTNLVDGLGSSTGHPQGRQRRDPAVAPEIKFFATQVETTNDLETRVEGMYVAGDGPGVAGNIVSAAATGLIPARAILAKIKGA